MNTVNENMKWQATFTHTEMGKWVTRIGASFTNKREAKRYIRECNANGEHLILHTREEYSNMK